MSRAPMPAESQRLADYLRKLRNANVGGISDDHAVWTEIASVLLNLHEFITRD
jgi:hypothetical protein